MSTNDATFQEGSLITSERAVSAESTHPFISDCAGWWPLDGNGNDVVAGRNVTWTGAANYGKGLRGASAALFSNSSYFDFPNTVPATATYWFTSFWAYPTATTGAYAQILGMSDQSPTAVNSPAVLLWANTTYLNLYSYGYGNNTTGFSLTLNQWHHFILAYSDSGAGTGIIGMYINGRFAWATVYAVPQRRPWRMGWDGGNGKYTGLIQDVAFFKRALRPQDVDILYNNGKGISYADAVKYSSGLTQISSRGLSDSIDSPAKPIGNAAAAVVTTVESITTDAAYIDLATVGPTVTINVPTTRVYTVIACDSANPGASGSTHTLSFEVSGATTIAAGTYSSWRDAGGSGWGRSTQWTEQILLNAGTNTITLKYRKDGGTWTVSQRGLVVTSAEPSASSAVTSSENPGATNVWMDLGTGGPSVAINAATSGSYAIVADALVTPTSGWTGALSFEVSGATTVAAGTYTSYETDGRWLMRAIGVVTLNAGVNVVTMKYRKDGGTWYFSERLLRVYSVT